MLDHLVASFLGMEALDERIIAHRHRSSRLAPGVGAAAIAVTKVAAMLWLAWTD